MSLSFRFLMVGSSASDGAVGRFGRLVRPGRRWNSAVQPVLTARARRGVGSTLATTGLGTVVLRWGAGAAGVVVSGAWRGSPAAVPEPLGMKEKSSASEDEIHGTCSPAGGAGHPDAGPVQGFFGHQIGNANFLEQFPHEQAAVAAIVGNHRRERGRIHHQRAVRRDHRRKAGGKAAEPALERIAPGGVDQRDLDAGTAAVDFAQHRFEAETVTATSASVQICASTGIM